MEWLRKISEEANGKKGKKDYRCGFLENSMSVKEREMLESIITNKNSEEPETCF